MAAARRLGRAGGVAGAVPEILRTLRDPDFHGEKLIRFIAGEPLLAARILRVANSAYYHQARRVSSVERAVVILGIEVVRGIAAVAALDMLMDAGGTSSPLRFAAFRQHCVDVAAVSLALAKLAEPGLAVDAFTCALLHDVGRLVQAELSPEGYRRLLLQLGPGLTHRDVSFLHKAEVCLVGVTHERCAECVFSVWNLPETLTIAVRFHHDPASAPREHRKLAALTYLGDSLLEEDAQNDSGVARNEHAQEQARSWLGLGREDLKAARDGGRQLVQAMAADNG